MKRSPVKKVRVHVLIDEEDWKALIAFHGKGGKSPIGISTAVNLIVHQYVKAVKGREATTGAVAGYEFKMKEDLGI